MLGAFWNFKMSSLETEMEKPLDWNIEWQGWKKKVQRKPSLGAHTTEVVSEALKQEDISWLNSGIILRY